ncbi:MAG: lytic murein transglycosylase [Alphaproteobacteria bacterium]|nr:lytic murein transglycosylase [Alphaproteobacteria bacterium]
MRTLARLLALSPAVLALVACAATQQTSGPTAGPAVRTAAIAPNPAPGDDAKFAAFVRDFRATALAAGIRPEVYDRSMAGISLNTHIQDLNLRQPEFSQAIWDYLDVAVSPKRVADGQAALAANDAMLNKIEARYGVPKAVLVAIWGLETNYGTLMGRYDMFEALATLGYDGPRQALGRRELLAALKMEQAGPFQPEEMISSWAGAFGQTQFMPTTWLAHAVDGDGDGKKDLWHSPADALASTAAMLAGDGWKSGQSWGCEVRLPANFPYAESGRDNPQPLSHWRQLGVTTALGKPLPQGPDDDSEGGSIFLPAGVRGPAFLLLHNFHVIMRYNAASSYALGVGLLADRISGLPGVVASWPRDEEPLSRDDRLAFQRALASLGYDPGKIDGMIGPKVSDALRAYQAAHGLLPDGFATHDLLMRLEREVAAKGSTKGG